MRNNPNFCELLEKVKKVYTIDAGLYPKYNVKRGLRNPDGTGVIVGLTNIGEVHGYMIEEGEKMPVEGRLSYRGVDVLDIVRACQAEGRHGFEETVYLLLFGALPTSEELSNFTALLTENRNLPENFVEDMIFKAPSPNVMNKLARCILSSYSYDENPDDSSVENVLRQSFELIARIPLMVAYSYQTKVHYIDGKSLIIHPSNPSLSTAENFLYMIRQDNQFTKAEADILDLCLILHAEHGGGNNSAFATHVLTSSGTDIYSAIAAAVGSLKGPKHGGANAKVMAMIDSFKENVDYTNEEQIKDYIRKILRKEAFDGAGLIYGMGHAVYTKSDPRAILLKEQAAKLAREKGMEDEFFLYDTIERETPALFEEVKGDSKTICANVDLYSGFVYRMLNIAPELYTPLFAISRVAGWCAHSLEEILAGGRIIRPAYKSVTKRKPYVPIKER